MDQPPRQGLGPNNQAWRQWVERSVQEVSKRLEEKFGPDVANSFRGTASSLGLLSKQVKAVQQQQETLAQQQATLASQQATLTSQTNYLASLVTDSITGGDVGSTDAGGSAIISGTLDPSLSFTLPQRLKCRITLRGTARLSISWASTTVFANASIITGVRMDGSILPGGQGTAYLSFGPNGVNGNMSNRSIIEAQVILDLDPGTHTAQSYYSFQGNGASVNMVVDNPTLTLEVIGLP